MDVHVPRSIVTALRRRGVDVLTAQEDGSARIDDPALMDRATELNKVLFSQDDDLLQEAARRQTERINFSGLIYTHQLRLSISECVEDLALLAQALDPPEMHNRVEFLPLK